MKKTVRALLTDGKRVVEVFWLAHKGGDVYYGLSFARSVHSSYHGQTGQRHDKIGDQYYPIGQSVPLAELQGRLVLATFAFSASLPTKSVLPEVQRLSKSEAVVFLDLRSIPKDSGVNVHVSLINPGHQDLLWTSLPGTRQIILLTSVVPWVEFVVRW
jgi:hypothetical protein